MQILSMQVSISSPFYELAPIFLQQSQNITREKLHKALLYKKFESKTLMKMSPTVNFINILVQIFHTQVLCAAFP